MSMDPEDALARARAIAAKLSGGGAVPATATATAPTTDFVDANAIAMAAQAAIDGALAGTTKRKRWGLSDDDDTNTSKKVNNKPPMQQQQPPAQVHSKRIWVGPSSSSSSFNDPNNNNNKPPSHYVLYLEKYPSELEAIQAQAPGVTSITLKGRGSRSSTVLTGMPEEPLHFMLEGHDIEAVTLAEGLCERLVEKMTQHELLQDDTQTYANSTNGGAQQLALSTPAITMLEEQIGVPNGVVGFIIGRGGESIISMQSRTGCKVQIQKEHDMAPGAQLRVITLQAPTIEAIAACRDIIQGMVQERIKTTNSSSTFGQAPTPFQQPPSQDSKLQEAIQAGHVLIEIKVPDTDVGLIIGKSGSTIRSIQDRSGANIQIPQMGDADNPAFRTVSITHPHTEGATLAQQLIEELLSTKKEHVPFLTMQVEIPDKDVGMCIGRSGCVVREMQNKSGCKIQIPSQSTPGAIFRIATVNGSSTGCQMVKQMIERIILEQSSQSVMSGTGYDNGGGVPGGGGYGQQDQQVYGGYGQAQGGYTQQATAYGGQHQYASATVGGAGAVQQDYSAEWAAYYAAQAAAQQQGVVVTHATTAAAPAPAAAAASGQQAADAYYEEFYRYAYYYGEPAARQYYGAWSPPEGTPNPYGTNPNGFTAPPDTAPAVATQANVSQAVVVQAPAPAGAPASVRDTGRRGVSNLPAWMTK